MGKSLYMLSEGQTSGYKDGWEKMMNMGGMMMMMMTMKGIKCLTVWERGRNKFQQAVHPQSFKGKLFQTHVTNGVICACSYIEWRKRKKTKKWKSERRVEFFSTIIISLCIRHILLLQLLLLLLYYWMALSVSPFTFRSKASTRMFQVVLWEIFSHLLIS